MLVFVLVVMPMIYLAGINGQHLGDLCLVFLEFGEQTFVGKIQGVGMRPVLFSNSLDALDEN